MQNQFDIHLKAHLLEFHFFFNNILGNFTFCQSSNVATKLRRQRENKSAKKSITAPQNTSILLFLIWQVNYFPVTGFQVIKACLSSQGFCDTYLNKFSKMERGGASYLVFEREVSFWQVKSVWNPWVFRRSSGATVGGHKNSYSQPFI